MYFPQASSINFRRSVVYGFGTAKTISDEASLAATVGRKE